MTIAASCWITREEADPRYDRQSAAFDPENWAPDCGHQACLDDPHEGWHDWDCAVATCRWNTVKAMCELDEGHTGDHVFVSPNEIILVFSDPTLPAAARTGARP